MIAPEPFARAPEDVRAAEGAQARMAFAKELEDDLQLGDLEIAADYLVVHDDVRKRVGSRRGIWVPDSRRLFVILITCYAPGPEPPGVTPAGGHPGAGIGSPNRPRRRLPRHPPALMTRAKYMAPLAQPETKWPTGRQTS